MFFDRMTEDTLFKTNMSLNMSNLLAFWVCRAKLPKTVINKNPLTNVSKPNPFSAPAGGACLPQSRRSPEELAEAAGAADAAARADWVPDDVGPARVGDAETTGALPSALLDAGDAGRERAPAGAGGERATGGEGAVAGAGGDREVREALAEGAVGERTAGGAGGDREVGEALAEGAVGERTAGGAGGDREVGEALAEGAVGERTAGGAGGDREVGEALAEGAVGERTAGGAGGDREVGEALAEGAVGERTAGGAVGEGAVAAGGDRAVGEALAEGAVGERTAGGAVGEGAVAGAGGDRAVGEALAEGAVGERVAGGAGGEGTLGATETADDSVGAVAGGLFCSAFSAAAGATGPPGERSASWVSPSWSKTSDLHSALASGHSDYHPFKIPEKSQKAEISTLCWTVKIKNHQISRNPRRGAVRMVIETKHRNIWQIVHFRFVILRSRVC